MDVPAAEQRPRKGRRSYLAFDLEIARIIPDGLEDWRPYRPFGITCAATLGSDGFPRVWHGSTPDGKPAPRMKREEAIQLVRFLQEEVKAGKTLLTWNGAGFDFDVLGEESGMVAVCSQLAYQHVDMMFHFFCIKGFGIGLDKAAKGMELRGKLTGVGGANAPKFWMEGRFEEVMDYVCQDVNAALAVCKAVESRKMLQWMTSKGTSQILPFPSGWLTVEEASRLPLPDTTWMRNAWPRSKFTGWIEAARTKHEAAGESSKDPQ